MPKLFDKNNHGVAQLVGSTNPWAYDLWKKGSNNNWMPTVIDMSVDVKQWNGDLLSEDEKLLVKRTLGLFCAGESMVANSVNDVEFKYITCGACRQYLMRKQFEESLHNATVKICCEAYNLSVQDVAEAYNNIPTIKKKQRWLKESLDSFGPDFNIDTVHGKQMFLKNFATYYLVCEGMWFFANFALIMSLGRQSKLNGLGDQISYTIRDESLHVEFGVNLLKQSQIDYPSVWTKDFKLEIEQTIRSGAELEMEYCDDILPNGVLGVNNETLKKYVKFLANFNLQSVGLNPIYDNAMENPFPWLGESQDAQSISAFFERRETNYQHAAALDDDF